MWVHNLQEWKKVLCLFFKDKEEIFCSSGDELDYVLSHVQGFGMNVEIEDQGNGFVSLKRAG